MCDIKRYPDRKLYLLIKSVTGWRFPEWKVDGEESHNQSLRSLLEARCRGYFKGDAELYFVGGAPVCHHIERFNDRVQPPFSSAQFFFKSQLIQGNLVVPDEYRWASCDEIKTLVPTGYWGAVKDVLSH